MQRRTFLEAAGVAIASFTLPQFSYSESRIGDSKPAVGMVSELRMKDGRLAIFLNGQPHDGIFCSTRSGNMKNFIDAGFDVFDPLDIPQGWVDDEKYDFTETDRGIEAFLRQKPDAKLIIRCGWYPRNFWWVLKHPEHASVPHVRDKHQQMPSYASMAWRQASGEALRRFVEHVENKYGASVIAYLPDNGEPGEWFERYAYTEDEDRLTKGYQMGDYSEPMQQAYRRFVQQKYVSVADVNRIYHANFKAFDEIRIPEPDRRLNSELGHLRSIEKEQAVIDFYEVLNLQVCETLIHSARQVKEGCRRKKLVLVFYGYQWLEQPRGGVSQARSGHVHLDEVLSSPDVDVLVAPYHYDFRQLEGVMSSQAPVSSVLRRGKQFIHECDGSTYLKPCWPCPDHHNPANPRESGNLLRRDLSRALMDGTFVWFMDLVGGMYDSPEMVAELKQTLAIGRSFYWEAGRSNRQVAVVLHSRDAFYQREGEPLRAPLIPQFKQHELERMGLGYDDLMLENLKYLDPNQTAQYKMWIFPSAVHLSADELSLIQKHCCRNGNHVLWMYAPGVLTERGIDLARVRQVSGFQLGQAEEAGELAVRTSSVSHPLLQGRKSPMVYGTYGELGPDFIRYHSSLRHYPGSDVGFKVSPRFFIANADATVLGQILDIPGEPAGLGVKAMQGWTSVLSTAPLVPKHILRNIAESAACHVYTDFLGQTYHCQNFVGIFAHETGKCLIRLPHRSRIVDVFNGKTISENSQFAEIDVRINDAVLLHYTLAS
jgi:hypothetical protein